MINKVGPKEEEGSFQCIYTDVERILHPVLVDHY